MEQGKEVGRNEIITTNVSDFSISRLLHTAGLIRYMWCILSAKIIFVGKEIYTCWIFCIFLPFMVCMAIKRSLQKKSLSDVARKIIIFIDGICPLQGHVEVDIGPGQAGNIGLISNYTFQVLL